jgi:large subunit ribosomal protein L28e
LFFSLIYRSGKNSFKYSGLANLNSTVDVSEVDGAVALSVSKKNGKLATSLCKKNTRRTIQAAGAVAASKRPDLKRAAMARAAAISKGLKKRAALAAAAQ